MEGAVRQQGIAACMVWTQLVTQDMLSPGNASNTRGITFMQILGFQSCWILYNTQVVRIECATAIRLLGKRGIDGHTDMWAWEQPTCIRRARNLPEIIINHVQERPRITCTINLVSTPVLLHAHTKLDMHVQLLFTVISTAAGVTAKFESQQVHRKLYLCTDTVMRMSLMLICELTSRSFPSEHAFLDGGLHSNSKSVTCQHAVTLQLCQQECVEECSYKNITKRHSQHTSQGLLCNLTSSDATTPLQNPLLVLGHTRAHPSAVVLGCCQRRWD